MSKGKDLTLKDSLAIMPRLESVETTMVKLDSCTDTHSFNSISFLLPLFSCNKVCWTT